MWFQKALVTENKAEFKVPALTREKNMGRLIIINFNLFSSDFFQLTNPQHDPLTLNMGRETRRVVKASNLRVNAFSLFTS